MFDNGGHYTIIGLRKQAARVAAMLVVGFGLCMSAVGAAIDAHKPVTYHFAVTNTTDKAQTVEGVRTSCACLKVAVATSAAIPPGGVLPFDVELNPSGMEGRVEKKVWVELAPSGRGETYEVTADVRLRLGFHPMDAAFGVLRRSDTGREIVARLSGYMSEEASLGEPVLEAKDASEAVFDVRLSLEGKSLVVKFRDGNVLPGVYSEVWTIPTSDAEIPKISFAVSACVADSVSVTPQVISVGWDEAVCPRFVMVRPGSARVPPMRILSAETKPRKWGDVKISERPMGGWRIDIENIDSREVRQFSKRPFLEVKTDLPGMETFELPLRVENEGGAE